MPDHAGSVANAISDHQEGDGLAVGNFKEASNV
jgi:hypothetical protein